MPLPTDPAEQLKLYDQIAREVIVEALKKDGEEVQRLLAPGCTVVKRHDDGDLTLHCGERSWVVTTEGEVFQQYPAHAPHFTFVTDYAPQLQKELKRRLEASNG